MRQLIVRDRKLCTLNRRVVVDSGDGAPCVCGPQEPETCWLRAVVCTGEGNYYGPSGDVFISQARWLSIGSPDFVRYVVPGAGGGSYCYRVITDTVFCCETVPDLLQDQPYLPNFSAATGCDDPACAPLDCPPGSPVLTRNCLDNGCNTDFDLDLCVPQYCISEREAISTIRSSNCRTLAPEPNVSCQDCDGFGVRNFSITSADRNITSAVFCTGPNGSTNDGTRTRIVTGCNPFTSQNPAFAPTSVQCASGATDPNDGQVKCSWSFFEQSLTEFGPNSYTFTSRQETFYSFSSPWLYVRRSVETTYRENADSFAANDDPLSIRNDLERRTETRIVRLSVGGEGDPFGLPLIDCGYDPETDGDDLVLPEPDGSNPGGANPIGPAPAPLLVASTPAPTAFSLLAALRGGV